MDELAELDELDELAELDELDELAELDELETKNKCTGPWFMRL